MSTTRTNTSFALPGISQYIRSNSVNTVNDNFDLENRVDLLKEEKKECNIEKLNRREVYKKNKNVSFHELEVQLMMKDKMIEELLEENGKLIDNMNKLEQDKVDERARIQQGTEMILQQVVEDNEWYKAQFLEMKNELEKAILQTRNKGRELSTMEKRCKNLIEEKETIQNFLDELTAQYDQRTEQIQFYKQKMKSMKELVNKFVGNKTVYKFNNSSNSYYSLNEIIQRIREIINGERDISKIDHLITQIQFNAKSFEAEINDILEKINDRNNKTDLKEVEINNLYIEKNSDNLDDNNKNIDINLNSKYQEINNELENAKKEITKLNYEIKRKAEIINELKSLNENNKLEILDGINNNKEDSQIKLLQEKVINLEDEKRELIKKLAKLNRIQPINKEYVNRKLLVISEEGVLSHINSINQEQVVNSNCSEEISEGNEKITFQKEFEEDSISDVVDKYIKYPLDYGEKKQLIQRNLFQRNKYF